MARQRTIITHLIAYLVATGTVIRYLMAYHGDSFQWIVYGLLAAFILLMLIEPWFSHRSPNTTHLYLVIQTGIIIALALIPPNYDYFSLLFLTLIIQAIEVFAPQITFLWISAYTIIMAILMLYTQGLSAGLPFIVIFTVLYLFLGSYAAVMRSADNARHQSQELLTELQDAHQKLLIYTTQSEELAIVQERNRLARNLHDSVTQTIFSMTMTVEAARILFFRDDDRAVTQLEKIQALAKSALTEMRSLVVELRPTAVTQIGFIPALRHHITMLEREHGLIVALDITGEANLPEDSTQRLFLVIQEALNNVVKHAQTDRANLTLRFDDQDLFLRIEDFGRGYSTEAITTEYNPGLLSMQERVDSISGILKIDSYPGQGTSITIEVASVNG
jgi:signal transduction histidine kinase